ncbi:T9SS type A sorting domain-containing protein [Vaginella massiliensis]|uniref:T9SS type A sorting domain-containing protein n=1 Tax=Vaginella massiliensis TaxID=1816680 RepID=UPI00083925D8|nr:T9SS type A sorting domain-containing protein [Vaginella massiliensis]
MKKLILNVAILASTVALAQPVGWTDQNTNIPGSQDYYVSAIHALNENVVWALPQGQSTAPNRYPNYVLVTSDGGNTWVAKTGPAPSGALISMIFGVDANTAFAVTAPYTAGPSTNGLYKTTDGGNTWSKKASVNFSNAASFANIVHFWDANTGFAIGDPVNGIYEAFKTTDGGETWSVLTTAPTTTDNNEFGYNGGLAVNGENVWLTSSTGAIWHTNDRGVTWTKHFTPISDFGGVNVEGSFGHISFSSATYGLVTGSDELLFYTTDGGANWEVLETSGFYNGDIAWVPGTEKTFISTSADFNNINLGYGSSISYDGGVTWNIIDQEMQRGAIGAANPNAVWAGHFQTNGVGGILRLDGSLSIEDLATTKVSLHAVVDQQSLKLVSNQKISHVTLVDMNGKAVAKFKGNTNSVSHLPKGVYVAKVQYENGTFGTVKFIK